VCILLDVPSFHRGKSPQVFSVYGPACVSVVGSGRVRGEGEWWGGSVTVCRRLYDTINIQQGVTKEM
jgi:hypothetical protein